MANYSGGILSDQIKFYHCDKIVFMTSASSPAASADTYPGIGFLSASGSTPAKWYKCTRTGTGTYTYSWDEITTGIASTSDFTRVEQLQAVPSLGGTTSKIDVTCLDDTVKKTIPGLTDYGDSIDFSFLYDPKNYGDLDALGKDNTKGFIVAFKAPNEQYTSGDMFILNAKCSVAINDVAVDSALTFTASLAPQSEIKRNPAVAVEVEAA